MSVWDLFGDGERAAHQLLILYAAAFDEIKLFRAVRRITVLAKTDNDAGFKYIYNKMFFVANLDAAAACKMV